MFDLITGSTQRPLRERAPGSKVVSIVLHVVILSVVIGIPLLRATHEFPDVPTMVAFVAELPAPAPPPPPPPPPAEHPAPAKPAPTPKPQPQKADALVAPTQAPSELKADTTVSAGGAGVVGGVEGGVPGGVVGGVVGGVSGGIVGGVVSAPPPPPPPAPVGPVRIGGQLKAPAIVHRVEPIYPDLAANAHITGIVILEARVGTDGCVKAVTVLRSVHPLLDAAAVAALKQWEYSPLVLNGIPTPFVLTVTFTFSTR